MKEKQTVVKYFGILLVCGKGESRKAIFLEEERENLA